MQLSRRHYIMSMIRHPLGHPLGHRASGEHGKPFVRGFEGAARMSGPWPGTFPTELVFEVFKYLPQVDLARACRVNRYCIHR